MRGKLKTLVSWVAACAIVLAGCSGTDAGTETATVQTQQEGFTPALDVETSGEITVVGDYSNFESLESAFGRFNEVYPNVSMSYTKLDDYSKIIPVTLEGADAPNIYVMQSWMAAKDDYDSCFEHAEDLSDPSLGLDLSIYREGLLHEEDGKLPMVPIFATTNGMLVNQDLFEREGVEIPATYADLVKVCETLKEKGYESPLLGYLGDENLTSLSSLVYPTFCGSLVGSPEVVESLNAGEQEAGETMRPVLECAVDLKDTGCIDLDAWAELEDNYDKAILRFLEGDVPMMACTGDTVSGTRKRESLSEAFTANPFSYVFAPVPLTDDGGYFLDSTSLQFSVNKDCEDLDITNEFMRFLISYKELGTMAEEKRLLNPTTDLSLDSVYAPFAEVPADHVVSPEVLGVTDKVVSELRAAVYKVVTGEMSIDEAVAAYGTLKE